MPGASDLVVQTRAPHPGSFLGVSGFALIDALECLSDRPSARL